MNDLNSEDLGLKICGSYINAQLYDIELHFLFFLCVTKLSQNSLLDASTDEAENEFAKYQLGF